MSSEVALIQVPPAITVEAQLHIKKMRGGAQSHMVRCSDGKFYVVKFRNNPQHPRVLANEMFATRLAATIGLQVPATAAVEVGGWLVERTPEMCIQFAHKNVPCEVGIHFGSQYVVDPLQGQVMDFFPAEMLYRVRNLNTFLGILVVDKWLGNTDGRQAAFWRFGHERKYRASFIDQGYCFNAGDWTFPDFPLRGIYARNEVYDSVVGWDSFEPWLSRVENMNEDVIWSIAAQIPSRWYGGRWEDLKTLVNSVCSRRTVIRCLIEAFRLSPRRPFPNWKHQVYRPATQAPQKESIQSGESRVEEGTEERSRSQAGGVMFLKRSEPSGGKMAGKDGLP